MELHLRIFQHNNPVRIFGLSYSLKSLIVSTAQGGFESWSPDKVYHFTQIDIIQLKCNPQTTRNRMDVFILLIFNLNFTQFSF